MNKIDNIKILDTIDEFREGKEYWERILDDTISKVSINPDYTRNSLYNQSLYKFKIDEELVKKIFNISKKQDIAVYTILLSILQIEIYKYTRQNDIIIGSPIYREYAKNNSETYNDIILLRYDVNSDLDFKELVRGVKKVIVDGYKNQYYPISHILNESDVKSFSPISFAMRNIHNKKEIDTIIKSHYNEITFIVNVIENDIDIEVVYNSKLFMENSIVRFSEYYTNILRFVLNNINCKISEIEMLKNEEIKKILECKKIDCGMYFQNTTIHELFEIQSKKVPNNIAVICKENKITYMELNEKSNRLAWTLRKKGVGPDTIVGILMEKSIEAVVSAIAVLKAGGAYLPIDPEYPKERIDYMLKDSNTQILICRKENSGYNIENIVYIEDGKSYSNNRCNLPSISKSNNLAYIIYTSGTTGRPKGAMIEHKNVVSLLFNDETKFDFNENDVWTMFHSFCFDFSVWEMYGALLYGGKLIIIPTLVAQDSRAYLSLLKDQNVTILNQTPTSFYNLSDEEVKLKDKKLVLRYVIFGGEALKPARLKSWKEKYQNTKLINMYGITETTVHVTYKEITENEICENKSNIGKTIATLNSYIMDRDMKLLPAGVAGELCVSGYGVCRGYINRPKLNEEKFILNPYNSNEIIYRSGDLVRTNENGDMEYLGRIDKQVKIRGHRVEIGEIEYRLLNYDGIKDVVVIPKKDKYENECLCSYFVIDKDRLKSNELSIIEVRKYLQNYLPHYMIPSYFIQLSKIPLNSNGKVDIRALPELQNNIITETKYEAPRNEIEKKLVNIWAKVLENSNIGINDNFFELGGHSLKAAIMISVISNELNKDISIKDVFEHPTISEISNLMKKKYNNNRIEILPAPNKKYYEASSAQKRIYTIQQIDPKSTQYNMTYVYEIYGEINKEDLERAFINLIIRHETLRTSFDTIENKIVQIIREHVNFKIEYDEIVENNLEEYIEKIVKPFDLNCAPLIRVALMKTNCDKYILVLNIHHIICDGISVGIMVKEIVDLYSGNELKPLNIKFKDFSEWQNKILKSEIINKQKEHWLNILGGDIPVLELPYDFNRPDIQSFEGDKIDFNIDEELTAKLNNLARHTESTMFMVLFSAYSILMFKYSTNEDIIIGCPIAGRRHIDLNSIIGMFVNTIAIRSNPCGNKKYIDYLKEIRRLSLEAFENQDLQFEELIELIKIKRDMSRNPIFDVMFAMQNMDISLQENIGKFFLKPLNYKSNTSKFDLFLSACQHENSISFSLEFSTKLFRRKKIELMVGHFINILKEITKDYSIEIQNIDMLMHTEKHMLLNEFNNIYNKKYSNDNICLLFEEQVKILPDSIALEISDKKFTYRELDCYVNKIANYLVKEHNIISNQIVGILMQRSEYAIMAMLGILKAGGCYVPIDAEYPLERIEDIVNDTGLKVIISQSDYFPLLNKIQWKCNSFDTYICIDKGDIFAIENKESNELMNDKLWDYVGESSEDDIIGGGWVSSYTGQNFSRLEMDEYADNVYQKLKPYLNKSIRVLEIGCASGITMFNIASEVKSYYGTDMSKKMIENNLKVVNKEGIKNITLQKLRADEIDVLCGNKFDVIIINSVIQYFPGYNYLRDIILKSIALLDKRGIIFIGDIMELEKKDELLKSLHKFKKENPEYKTKLNFSTELFVSKRYFNDLRNCSKQIKNIKYSDKIFTVKNELTNYRYDLIIEIDKENTDHIIIDKKKMQHDYKVLQKYSHSFKTSEILPNSLAYMIYTSGSTGKPKGVMIEHKSLINLIKSVQSKVFSDKEKSILSSTNICFDIFIFETLIPLCAGMKVILANEEQGRDSKLLSELVINKNVDIIQMTPSRISTLLNSNRASSSLEKVKKIILGGQIFSNKLLEQIKEKTKARIYNMYAPSETCVYSTLAELTDTDKITIGKPLDNTKIYILDKYKKMVPLGCKGEIYISGHGVARGYLNNPKLTSDKFIDNPFIENDKMYKTGDLGCWNNNAEVVFLGRVDSQVKLRGYRVELEEIEDKLCKFGAIKEAIVLKKIDKKNNLEYLCSYIVCSEELDIDELRCYLKNRLPEYMIPGQYNIVDKMPLTRNGKIDKNELANLSKCGMVSKDYKGAESKIEEKLINICEDILSIEGIGVNNNFFDLGGNSLSATLLSSRIFKEFNVEVPLKRIFEVSTIRKIAKYIGTCGNTIYSDIKSVAKSDYYETSSSQKRLYILHQLGQSYTEYNMPMAVELCGGLDLEKIRCCFDKLVERHEMLRSSFDFIDGVLVQKVDETVNLKIDCINGMDVNINELIQNMIKPFVLKEAPLFRVTIIKKSEDSHILLIDMHHIITDGVSMQILFRDFINIYEGNKIDKLNLQYKDYAAWQNKLINSDKIKKQEDYWFKVFSKEVKPFELPYDYKRPQFSSFSGDTICNVIEGELAKKILFISRKTATTEYMVLLSAYVILLSKYSGVEDITVGMPIAGRVNYEFENVVGMFVNTLALRNYPSYNKTYGEFLLEVKENCLNAYENQDLPFDYLVDKLKLKRKGNRNPIFDTMFVMQNMKNSIENTELTIKPIKVQNETSRFDITFNIYEKAKGFNINVEYSDELFSKEKIIKIYDDYIKILEIVLENLDIKIEDINLINEDIVDVISKIDNEISTAIDFDI